MYNIYQLFRYLPQNGKKNLMAINSIIYSSLLKQIDCLKYFFAKREKHVEKLGR